MALPQDFRNVSEDDLERILYLLEYSTVRETVSNFLEEKGQYHSGNWDTLKQRLRNGIENDKFTVQELAKLLDQYESFGHQHVYLYDVNVGPVDNLRERRTVEGIVKQLDTDLDVNEFAVLWLPDEPKIGALRHDKEEFVVKWVQRRDFLRYLGEEPDEDEPHVVLKKYREETERLVNVFRLDLEKYQAELRVHQLPDSSKYKDHKDTYEQRVAKAGFLDLKMDATAVKTGKVIIQCLEGEPDIRIQRVKLETSDQAEAGYSVRNQSDDITENSIYQSLDEDTRRLCYGKSARVYWLPTEDNEIEEEVSTLIYADRVAFTTAATQKQVEHVLRRVRTLKGKAKGL